MANEVDPKEFGVMSAAQLLANQIGQVAGIEVSFTIQQALMRHRGLEFPVHPSANAAILETFRLPMLIGAVFAVLSLAGSFFFRSVPRGDSLGDLTKANDHSL